MKCHFILIALLFYFNFKVNAQLINSFIEEVSVDQLTTINRELSGEDSTTVNGNKVLISHRVSNNNNNLAADYLYEHLSNLGLTVTDYHYRSSGRDIFATQLGSTYPDSIFIVCGHYDSVTDFCADDNVSGVATVLELARILSQHCFEKTIIYALWDEEEIGFWGSKAFSDSMKINNANIVAVLNMDMMAYDGNDDSKFDIDVRNIAQSYAIRDSLINFVTRYNFDLEPIIVDPGTTASDHSKFWQNGYSAVLFGESWETNDHNPAYHSALDRVNLYNWPYYHKMAQLAIAYIATMAVPELINDTVEINGITATAQETDVAYQWINCSNMQVINEATQQVFVAEQNGFYAVILDKGNCIDTSDCYQIVINKLDMEYFKQLKVYPNPLKNKLTIDIADLNQVGVQIFEISGKLVFEEKIVKSKKDIDMSIFPNGAYIVEISKEDKSMSYKIIKD